jgi:S-DNA-T family DNA segregation ATPase FtsK/SpoIIIE
MMTLAMPVMSSVAVAGYMFSYGKPLFVVLGVVFMTGSVGAGLMMRHQMRKGSHHDKVHKRERYLEFLNEVRQAARDVAGRQRLAAAWLHPSPERLWAIAVRRRRVWERRAADADFLLVRLGLGRDKLATPIELPRHADPLAEYDSQVSGLVGRLINRLGTVGCQPAWADLGSAGVVSLLGSADRVRALARALVMQVAVLHAPQDVAVAVCTSGDEGWEWVKWLPHTRQASQPDLPELLLADQHALADLPLVAASIEGLADVLEAETERGLRRRSARPGHVGAGPPGQRAPADRRLLVMVDSYDPAAAWARSPALTGILEVAGPESGITVVCLVSAESAEPTRTQLRARVGDDGSLTLEGPRRELQGPVTSAVADQAEPALAELTARALAPLRLSQEPDRRLITTISLPEMLGVTDLAAFSPVDSWRDAANEQVLQITVGQDADGEPVTLDLKESAQGGMGPHGLIVGATGSGKSELLRTLVTGLTMTHSPELLNLVLIDFKGGATFAGLTELPHVAGLITNLADDLSLVDRVRAALHGEQQRRQKLLRDAGNADSLRDYHARRAAGLADADGKPLPPLPYLLIVVDEFGELLSQRNDFIDLFVQIGRVGRSLGMHLLLATQRLDEGRLRGLESHLSYRICLRTFSAPESRAVIGTPDAYHLPPVPGSAYLKVSEAAYRRFKVAHISGPYQPSATTPARHAEADVAMFGLRTGPAAATGRDETRPVRPAFAGPTAMQVIAGRLCLFGEAVHQVWLPPLPAAIPLDAMLGPLAEQPGRGWQAQLWPHLGRLAFPVGLMDLPLQQRQEPLILDFARKDGNVAVVGAPQTGKSSMLRTVLLSAMLTHTPQEVQFYCLDFGGGTLAALAGAPHIGAIADRRDPHTARRILSEALRLITSREHLYADLGIESAAAFRALAGANRLAAGTRAADVFVVVDNWAALRSDLEEADSAVAEIAFRGLGVGVHLILTASRWADIRLNLRDGIGTRLELRLNDPAESEVSRLLARQLSTAPAGRGAAPPGLLFHVLAPRLDGMETMDDIGEAQEETIAKIRASWAGPAAPPVRLLPGLVLVSELGPAARPEDGGAVPAEAGVPVGLSDADLSPVRIDLTEADPHLLVLGDAGAGKTTFLHTLLRGLTDRHGPDEIRFMLVDYRRSLLQAVPSPYIGAYAGDVTAAREYASQLGTKLARRLPPPGLSSGRLARDWWTGPDLYLVADDYDLAATGLAGPLAPLADYIPHAKQIGLHVILARRVGGWTRTLTSDPLLTRIRELGTAGLILSGDPREGILLDTERAAQRPPGRGVLLRRRRPPVLIQVAVHDEHDHS